MSNRTRWLAVVCLLAIVIAAVGVITTLMHRLDEADGRIATLTKRVMESEVQARTAASRAENSSRAAEEARTHAMQAAEARRDAEMAKVRAQAQATEAVENADKAREEMVRIREQRQADLDRMQKALDRVVETRRTAFGMVMNLPESALRFDFNSATIRPQGREVLSRIAGILLTSGDFGLAVHGHTDDVGSPEYNLLLSERRAGAVKAYLEEAGIDPAIVTIKGYGKSSPLAKGTDDASRAKNRRVEIALTDTQIEFRGEIANN